MDKSGANLAALEALNAERSSPIKVRQNKYLNNVVEQDPPAIKLIIKPMMGFKDFRCARIILSGIETMGRRSSTKTLPSAERLRSRGDNNKTLFIFTDVAFSITN
ncbi:Transposase [Caballeronia sordidicola]|uniref:Transposase n=1 Tax=Caballeronia sordidicola TaxID=196367 RepID=A0A242N053_CABSO|nr:Transposase [Caballeronia sordidicola]